MTPKKARKRAMEISKRNPEREYYLIWSDEEQDRPQEHYHVADESELESFFIGIRQDNILAVYRNGYEQF